MRTEATTTAPRQATAVTKRPLSEDDIIRRARHVAPEWQGQWGQEVRCSILGPNGNPTTTVTVANFGDPAFWFFYTSGFQFASEVRFVAFPAYEGSPLQSITQRFEFTNPEDGNISTPFGIPNWGLDLTAGPWALVVIKDNAQAGLCRFTVIAP